MRYSQLNAAYKYDVLAGALYAREVELFHYRFDAENYRHILHSAAPGKFREDISKRLSEAESAIETVVAVIAALESQISDTKAFKKAVSLAAAKRRPTWLHRLLVKP